MSANARGSAPTYLPGHTSPVAPRCPLPSGSNRLTLKSPANSSLAPRGRPLSAATTLSILEVSSGGEVTSHNLPLSLPCCHMEADDVEPKLLDGLHREMRCRPVEHCHSAAVSDWRVRSDDAVPSRPAGVDSISYLGFLKYVQVHVGLVHPPQCQLNSPISSIPNVIGAKHNQHPPPRRIPSIPTHPPPMDAFLSPDPAALLNRAGLPLLPLLVPFRPRQPSLSCPVPVLSSTPTPCCSPWHGVLRSSLTPGQVALHRGYCGC